VSRALVSTDLSCGGALVRSGVRTKLTLLTNNRSRSTNLEPLFGVCCSGSDPGGTGGRAAAYPAECPNMMISAPAYRARPGC